MPEIRNLADRYQASVMIDDAHGTGVLGATGRGTLEHFGLEGKIDLICGTFSKSFGSIGGFTCATRDVVDYLRLNARPFIFTASPPASVMATVLACLKVLESEPELLQKMRDNSAFMKRGLRELGFNVQDTITPIIPVLIGNDEKTFEMAGRLEAEGVIVNPIVPPAVSSESSLIRVSIMASLSEDDMQYSLDKFAVVGKSVGIL